MCDMSASCSFGKGTVDIAFQLSDIQYIKDAAVEGKTASCALLQIVK